MNFITSPNADSCGTSFHGVTIRQSLDSLLAKLGKPHYEDGDKTQYEWVFTSEDGRVVTLYDWKSYSTSPSSWHIGGFSKEETQLFANWLTAL